MKKLMTGVLALAIAGAMMGPVNAESTSVTYNQSSSYEITIPASVVLNKDTVVTQTISMKSINMTPTEKIIVKVTNGVDNSGYITLNRTGGGTAKVRVSLSQNGAGITPTTIVADFRNQITTSQTGTGTLYYSAVGSVNSGSYSTTLTFTVSKATI